MSTIKIIDYIAGSVTPLLTIIVAFFGLTTWRKKLWGENKFSLALSVIKELYLLKEEIRSYRNPLYLAGEIYQAFKKVNESNPEEKYDQDKAVIYAENIRWNKVVDQYEKYISDLVKFKVLINDFEIDKIDNDTIMTYLKEINSMRMIKEMHKKRENYLQFMDEEHKEKYLEQDEKAMKILNNLGDGDEFDSNVENYFKSFKKRVRKYLR